MRYSIYCIKNTVNDKVYVGYTSKSIRARFASHLKNARSKVNRRLYDSMNHHGYDKFVIFELDETHYHDKAREMESWYIYLLDSKNPQKGYNMTWGEPEVTHFQNGVNTKRKSYTIVKKQKEKKL